MRPLHPLVVAFMHREEGLRLDCYDDHDGASLYWDGNDWRRKRDGDKVLGFATIGRGRRLWPGEIIETCTLEQADAWFLQRVMSVDAPAVDRLWPNVDDFQRGALIDFSYNAGSGALAQEGVTPDKLSAIGSDAFGALWCAARLKTRGVVSAVLVGRRAREWALFTRQGVPLGDFDVTTVLESVHKAGNQMVLELPSLAGVTLSDDEDPH